MGYSSINISQNSLTSWTRKIGAFHIINEIYRFQMRLQFIIIISTQLQNKSTKIDQN